MDRYNADGTLFLPLSLSLSPTPEYLSLFLFLSCIMLLRLQLCARSFLSSGAGDFSDHHQTFFNNHHHLSRSLPSISYSTQPQLYHYHRRSKPLIISCNSSRGRRSKGYGGYQDDDDDYLEAAVLITDFYHLGYAYLGNGLGGGLHSSTRRAKKKRYTVIDAGGLGAERLHHTAIKVPYQAIVQLLQPEPPLQRFKIQPPILEGTSNFLPGLFKACETLATHFGVSWAKFWLPYYLCAETMMHHQMRIQGYQEVIKWQPTGKLFPFSGQGKGPRPSIQMLGPEFLQQYRSPTIFLKISCDCDGDYLLPIIVGEYAVEKLISSSLEDEGDSNQFQLVRNMVAKLGYEVKRVQITERVNNIYFANICFHKPGTEDIRVDARPSDAINVAKRCRAPIYVSKRIVLTDAVKIVYGMANLRDRKPTYDVFLDSAIDGPDVLAEELDIVTKMNIAAKEERYDDA
ncbi:hypothetical protein OSB04_006923, partial [Centaurea solstitialis]